MRPSKQVLARADIVTRRALRAVMNGFASRPPSRPGEPSTCRRCGAPVPEPPVGSVVSRCVHCQAANVMGTDLRADADEATAVESELVTVLGAKRIEVVIRVLAIAMAVVAGGRGDADLRAGGRRGGISRRPSGCGYDDSQSEGGSAAVPRC